jgi:hypothetical protein
MGDIITSGGVFNAARGICMYGLVEKVISGAKSPEEWHAQLRSK